MTSVEKRRSSRKSGGHRKHSDGSYSDTSSGGSFLDETDREVSNLTDRAFRSLCIGDEAVYNDSDLGSSSPCVQRDRQLAFRQSSQDKYREDREELKQTAHESFSARVQQYGQDGTHGGRYGAEIQRDPLWEVYGDRTQGRVSATFQHNVVETSQQERSLQDDQLSLFSNGATDLSSQQRRSRSRVSSLIRAFNSDTNRDGGMDEKLREWNNESSWDQSALMNMQRELSEFSSSYQQNFNSEYFPTSDPYSTRDTGFYSSDVAAHMNPASSFMSASHSMSTQVNCNSNFFIHSEFSPFRVWRNHNRFPFQHGEVSGFMHSSEFPKWYETPMYRELSQEPQPPRPYGFQERSIIHQRNNMVPMVPPTPPRSTSTSMMQQKAYAVEKRCESELAGNYPHRKRTQSLGTNRLTSQRPSTASPTVEMSRRVRDTISSVKALQQKIKMMAEQNMETEMTAYQPPALHSRDNSIPFGNNAVTAAPNVVRGNRTPLNISQMLTPSFQAYQEAGTSLARQGSVSPQLVEHAPVRAESRGATPDSRMSTYKSRATSLLFNLKDNRKRVKNKYSPTKFKQQPAQEPRDTVIDIPDYPDPDNQFSQAEVFNRTSAAAHQYGNQYQNPAMLNSHPQTVQTGQYSQWTSSDYQTAHMQGEMVHHSRFTGFMPENYTTNQMANGQNSHQDFSPFTPYKQGMRDNAELQGGDVQGFKPSYRAAETPRNAVNNQTREHFLSQANAEQHFNETVRRDGCQQLIDNQHNYNIVTSQDRWKQTNSQDTERHRAAVSPWKQEITTLMEKDQHAQTYPRAAPIKEELMSHRDKHGGNQQNVNSEFESRQFMGTGGGLVNPGISDHVPQYPPDAGKVNANKQQHYGPSKAMRGTYAHQYHKGQHEGNESKDNYMTQNYDRSADQEYKHQYTSLTGKNKNVHMQETSQTKQYTEASREQETVQPVHASSLFEPNVQRNPLSSPDSAAESTVVNQVKDGQLAGVKAGESAAEHAQKELAKAQHRAQVEQPKAESAGLILATQSGSEKVKAEGKAKAEATEHERIEQDKSKERREEIHPEYSTKEQIKPKATEETRDMKKEGGSKHTRVEQCDQVKADQAIARELKEANIKTDLEKSSHTNIRQTVQARGKEGRQVKAEQNEREQQEQIQREMVKAEWVETEQKKMKVCEMEAFKDLVKVKDGENKKDSIQATVDLEKTTTQLSKAKEAKVEEQIKVERPKTEDLHERFRKPGSKQSAIIQVKGEPDKVEQVKTELAKAKAELAKIKEKMKGQKDNIKLNLILMEDDNTKKDFPLNANMVKDEVQKKDQAAQKHKQTDQSLLSKYVRDQVDRGGESYNSLREKYGFTNTLSTNRSKDLTAKPDDKETPTLSLDTTGAVDSKNQSPTNGHATINTTNKEEVGSYKSCEEVDGHYVYSESSKEFKLSGSDNTPAKVGDGASCDSVEGKAKNVSAGELEKCEAVKHASDSDTTKLRPLDRKLKSVEHSAGSSKDLHVTPARTLTHKERAQTKQELLTSKIKAHAEKEISAIKEKGFALRDLSKNTTKQLVGSQSLNIRQRPPSQEVSRKHESTTVSNTTPKRQMEQSGIQMETVKSVSTPSSATISVMSAANTAQTKELSQKQVSKDPVKSKENVHESIRDTKETGQEYTITNTGLVEKQKKENQSVFKSSIQSKELAPEEKHGKQGASHETKQRGGLKDKHPIITDPLSTNNKDVSQAASLAKAEAAKPTTSAKPESKPEEVQTDSAPSINFACQHQNKTPVADDDLQIMGIMVIVRERKPSDSSDQKNNSTQVQASPKEYSNSELDKIKQSSGTEASKGKDLSHTKDRVVHDMQEESTKVHIINCENVRATKKENVSESVNEKSTQKRNSHRGTQEPLTEKVVPSITAPAKNKVLAETQHHLHKQDIKDSEKKDGSHVIPKDNLAKVTRTDEEKNREHTNHPMPQIAHTNNNLQNKVENTEITNKNDLNKSISKHDVEQTEAETTVINPPTNKDIGGKSGPLLEQKTNNSTPLQQINKTTSEDLTEKRNNHVSPKVENKETHTVNKKTDVHIDGIAVRVVPRCSEPSNDDSLCLGAKVNSSSNNDRIKELSPEDELKVQHVLSSVRKLSDSLRNTKQHNSMVTTSENTENQRPDCPQESREPVDESKVQGLVGDYFQVQGTADTNNDEHKSANVGQTLHGASQEKQPPTPQTKNNAVSEEVKHDAFVFTKSMIKTVESNKSSFDNENMEKKTWISKRTEGPTERQESDHFRKNHTVNQSTISSRERPSLKNTYSTGESSAKEKYEVKPKPKERVSTIPEISALADYARLKVIVSEERENTLPHEFPPNKKEGFFPLIQSRHSRRPVFTDDPKDISVKEKRLPNKTEMSAKVSKEPKALVFPITESKHQRTGMFKLGDIDKQEKGVFHKSGESDAGVKSAQPVREGNKSPISHLKKKNEERVAGSDNQTLSVPLPNTLSLEATSSLSAVNEPKPTSAPQQLKSPVNTDLHENPERFPSTLEITSSDKDQVHNIKDTSLRKDEKLENKTMRQGGNASHCEQATTKISQEEESMNEEEKRTEEMRIKRILDESRASLVEEERRAAQREEERRAREREAIALRIKERREKQRETDKREEEEGKAKQTQENNDAPKEEEIGSKQRGEERREGRIEKTQSLDKRRATLRGEADQLQEEEERTSHDEQQKRAAEEEEQRRIGLIKEQQRRANEEEQKQRAEQEEQRRKAAIEEQQRRAVIEEQQREAAAEEMQRKAELEEQQRKAAIEEQRRRTVAEEEQRRAAAEEQQRKAAIEEHQRKAAIEEQQRKAAIEEQQRRAAIEEQQRKAAIEEQQRKAAIEEQQRKAAIEEQQRKAAIEDQQRKAAIEEQQRKAAIEEQQRKAAIEEQQRRAAIEEEQRAAIEEEQRRAAIEEEQRRAVIEEEHRGAAIEKQQRSAAIEEEQIMAAIEEQQRRAAIEEEQRKATLIEEQLRKAAKEEEQQRAVEKEKQQKAVQEEHQRIAALEEQQRRAALEEQQRRAALEQQQRVALIEEQRKANHNEEKREAQGKQAKEERTRKLEEKQGEEETERPAGRDDVNGPKNRVDEKLAAHREKEKAAKIEEQRRAAQMTDALQYYAITSAEPEKKPKERQLRSPLPHHQKTYQSVRESAEDPGYHIRLYRSHGPASPAPSQPRSNTSSPALGAKPSMFKVKDNTMRASPFKSIKPRFHKNFGEEFRVGSPMERVPERGEEVQEIMRHSAAQPETSRPPVLQDYSAHLPQHRPYSRRSITLDEDDSRSVMSNMSEDVESFATSVADLADLRGLYDHDRPESACSFSSDLSRSMGRPPVVPPKSEKALRRAKRLTSRRIKKELCKSGEDIPALQEASGVHPPSTEVQSSNRYAVASPHISPPIALAHAPELRSGLTSSHTEHPSSQLSVRASPHATGPISLPLTSPHAVASVALPTAPHPATVPASHTPAPQTVSHVSSSPVLHRANHPAPVTQYHLESSYPQSYPLTQRKVLQDLGSGQYYVVDVPVPVKTKTFFDPETGKYVQLNVRESGKSTSLPHPQHSYPQPQLQNQIVIKSQQEPISQASPTGKPLVRYQGHQGYTPGYQPAAVNSVPPHRSSVSTSHQHNPHDVGENHSHGHPAPAMRQSTDGTHRYSPEKTPYMDTVSDTEKRHNMVYNTRGSYEALPECDTNSQLAGSSICENESSAPSRCQPRDIITMGELEDFMEVSDW